ASTRESTVNIFVAWAFIAPLLIVTTGSRTGKFDLRRAGLIPDRQGDESDLRIDLLIDAAMQ
ncbi:MAG: hypothetical protein V3S44_05105, partial [Alphaproteobacteria bacterium]